LTASNLLLTPERRLRAPFKILVFIVVLVICLLLTSALEAGVDTAASRLGYDLLVSEWGVTLGSLLATLVVLKAVDGRGWAYVHLDRTAFTSRKIGGGALLGLLPIAVPSLLLLAFAQLRAVPSSPGSWWAASGISFANLLPAAATEELLLRGYVFAALKEALGARWTLIATSVIFGLLHMPNPGADAESIAIVMLAGFFLGSVLLATRSLYAAIAAHFVWNWFMAAGLHSAVSGIGVMTPDYQVVDAGPDWLTGGAWGPEGGFAAAIGMFVVLIYLHARPLRRMES
jgi:membrane protease YdiL (CAAX protease family)